MPGPFNPLRPFKKNKASQQNTASPTDGKVPLPPSLSPPLPSDPSHVAPSPQVHPPTGGYKPNPDHDGAATPPNGQKTVSIKDTNKTVIGTKITTYGQGDHSTSWQPKPVGSIPLYDPGQGKNLTGYNGDHYGNSNTKMYDGSGVTTTPILNAQDQQVAIETRKYSTLVEGDESYSITKTPLKTTPTSVVPVPSSNPLLGTITIPGRGSSADEHHATPVTPKTDIEFETASASAKKILGVTDLKPVIASPGLSEHGLGQGNTQPDPKVLANAINGPVPEWNSQGIDPKLGGIGGDDLSVHGDALAIRDSKDGTKFISKMNDGTFQSIDKTTGAVAGAGTWGENHTVAAVSSSAPPSMIANHLAAMRDPEGGSAVPTAPTSVSYNSSVSGDGGVADTPVVANAEPPAPVVTPPVNNAPEVTHTFATGADETWGGQGLNLGGPGAPPVPPAPMKPKLTLPKPSPHDLPLGGGTAGFDVGAHAYKGRRFD